MSNYSEKKKLYANGELNFAFSLRVVDTWWDGKQRIIRVNVAYERRVDLWLMRWWGWKFINFDQKKNIYIEELTVRSFHEAPSTKIYIAGWKSENLCKNSTIVSFFLFFGKFLTTLHYSIYSRHKFLYRFASLEGWFRTFRCFTSDFFPLFALCEN